MNPLDRKLTTVFKTLTNRSSLDTKPQNALKDFRELRSRVVDSDLLQTLDGLVANFSAAPTEQTKPAAPEAFKVIMELRQRGYVEAPALLFLHWRDVMMVQKLEDVLPIAPDAASLEIWRKASRVPAKELEIGFLVDPATAYTTVAADWLLLHAKPEQVQPVLELFLERKERPKALLPWAEALVPALKKDKRGNLLELILCHHSADKGRLATLAEVMRLNRKLLLNAVEHLPVILCKKEAPHEGVFFVQELFANLLNTQGAEREFVTAGLARLGCGILIQDRRGPQADAVLGMIAEASRRLRNLTTDETIQSRTWVLENLVASAEPMDGNIHVTIIGARQLALALEKAALGFAAKDILTATARNLGLTLIGKKAEAVSYNPLQHEDVVGGMLPGDNACIDEPGWALGQDVVVRAKVNKGESNV